MEMEERAKLNLELNSLLMKNSRGPSEQPINPSLLSPSSKLHRLRFSLGPLATLQLAFPL